MKPAADPRPKLILITGIMAAGKSSVAQAVAERLPQSVHLRGDVFRRMIVNGQAAMSPTPTQAARSQLLLRYRLAADATDSYLRAGFSVVYQDVILGEDLARVISSLQPWPVHVVVLCPGSEVVAARAEARGKAGYGSFSVAELDAVLRQRTPRLGLWLDTSDLSVTQSAAAVLDRLDEARIQAAGAPPD